MQKKLYRVKVVMYVMAENESEARVAATNARFDIFECSARKADHVDPAWVNAIPYNSDDDRTCGEIFVGERQVGPLAIPFPTNGRQHSQVLNRAVSYISS
jgi:hypothetical protein